MLASKAARIAQEQMKCGHNCCQSVIIAASQVLAVPVGEDILAAASLFGGGMGSGCTCGALAGMIMVSGVLERHSSHPLGPKLSGLLHDIFKQQFGATCCRVIKKKRHVLQNIGNRACIELTGQAVEMLVREWEGVLDASASENLNHHPHA
ncbi:MAG: C-GCAxxG-C-C family protein [Bacillota bacterium]|jgi:C_GCAxxG_C_C family probable redox protein